MTPREFEMQPAHKALMLLPLFIGLIGPGIVLVILAGTRAAPHEWLHAAPMAAMPFVALVLAWNLFGRKFRLSDAGLRIRTLPWPRTIPVAEFELDRAEIIDLSARPELMPTFKIAGSRMPGYRAGRFRLRDKRTASVLITDTRRVLVLPRRDGGVVMLSLQRPDALLQALRQQAERGRG